MLNRRLLLAMTGTVLAAVPVRAQTAPDATRFIVDLGNRLVAIINGPGAIADKRERIRPLVEQAADIQGIARFSLGRFWNSATPQQRSEYLQLFRHVLLNNVFGKIGEYQGVSFQPTTTTQRGQDILVGTTITRPNQQPNAVQWVVNFVGGRPKIVDIVAEGVSIRQTQRSDYAAFLSRNGNSVDALLQALRQQVGQ